MKWYQISRYIACLRLSMYRGIGNNHVYAQLEAAEQERTTLLKVLSDSDARNLNRYDRFCTYEEGVKSNRFNDREEAERLAIKVWKEHYPDAVVLVRGSSAVVDPRYVLDGPPSITRKLNAIYCKCKELGWWDGGHYSEVDGLMGEWYDILSKYIEGVNNG